jgi:hypothetical protein
MTDLPGDDVLELTLPDDLDLDSWEIIEEDERTGSGACRRSS